ncbi:MAG: diacylglycerol kinase family protein [Phycisphaerae bacterium]
MKPQDGYIAFIVNPKSGAQSSRFRIGPLEKYLINKGFEVRPQLTHSLGDACEFATEAAVDYNCALVVAAGGDGTIREVAHGLEGTNKPLLIVPQGTENLLANELGFDRKLQTVVKAFEGGCIKTMDLGRINGRCFTCIAGFGFDGDIVRRISRERNGHITYLDYFWPIWRTFWAYKYESVKVEVDSEVIFEGRGIVFVGNISRYALGLNILQRADFSDGLLDVCVYACQSRTCLIKHSVLTVFKQHLKHHDVVYRQGKKIKISSEHQNVFTEIDGDPGPALPVEIEIVPKAVNFLVPPGAKPAGFRERFLRLFK